jgi:hypothetical protein
MSPPDRRGGPATAWREEELRGRGGLALHGYYLYQAIRAAEIRFLKSRIASIRPGATPNNQSC